MNYLHDCVLRHDQQQLDAGLKKFNSAASHQSPSSRPSPGAATGRNHLVKCPQCRLINGETASRCDCGYNFETGIVERVHKPQSRASRLDFFVVLGAVAGLIAYAVYAFVRHLQGGSPVVVALVATFLDPVVVIGVIVVAASTAARRRNRR